MQNKRKMTIFNEIFIISFYYHKVHFCYENMTQMFREERAGCIYKQILMK